MMYVILVPVLLVVSYWFWKNGNVQRRFLAYFFNSTYMRDSHKLSWTKRKDMFKDMENLISHDSDLRKKGSIRILEIGVGGGCNICLFPKNCQLVALDPNEFFVSYLHKTLSKLPHVHLERFVLGKAEKMDTISDGSIDAVVSTDVLCSLDDIDQSLAEIKRVLGKGGKYYFLNHMAAPEGTWVNFFQKLLYYPWKFVYGCNNKGQYERHLELAGFSKINFENLHFGLESGFLLQLVSYYIVGTATK